uniref:Uncharacterized protein n=1 Tax=Noctiluca scintillans TaxID=2966 RepID=A0A7S1A0U7_NOCSC|mmetsp:Transcript_2653/g.7924  ORF Transcript_2653/g.7924 Transcript_2653/m.7924 type:complete len:249 (+) Transcript_2653:90-836(+)
MVPTVQAGSELSESLLGESLDFPRGWRFVWCHERCHKEEHAQRRALLSALLREQGASLSCLKKAAKFALWLEHAPRPPSVLVTDWREAQGCFQAILSGGSPTKVLCMIVLCTSARQRRNASDWAHRACATLPDFTVHVHEANDIPDQMVCGLVRRVFGDDPVRNESSVSLEQPSDTVAQFVEQQVSVPPAVFWDDRRRDAAPTLFWTSCGFNEVPLQVAAMLFPICACRSSAEVAILLKQVLPDLYEE